MLWLQCQGVLESCQGVLESVHTYSQGSQGFCRLIPEVWLLNVFCLAVLPTDSRGLGLECILLVI